MKTKCYVIVYIEHRHVRGILKWTRWWARSKATSSLCSLLAGNNLVERKFLRDVEKLFALW